MIGQYRHRVTLGNPGDPVPDGDGGYTETFAPLDPAEWDCSIQAASTRDLESIGAGTVLAQATHLVKGRYHAGITTESQLTFNGRTLNVVYVTNRDERNIETILVCAEVVP
jgi:SPP1 family predicted phage head-tail adaptor